MKKASKILTLILIAVFVLSIFAGCNLVGRNVAKYRSAEALKVGDQIITVGKLLDTFNTYYNNYYYYISAGYLDASQLLSMAVSSLVQQYMQLDDYIAEGNHQPYDKSELTELQTSVANANYLSKDEFAYAVKYVNYLAYNAFDQYTEDSITGKYDLEDAPTEDTSRDFTEYETFKDMNGNEATSYAQYTRDQNFVNEDANEYFENNYPFLTKEQLTNNLYLDGYVYDVNDAAQKEKAQERVKEYNDRRTDDEQDELTLVEYINILKDTQKQYRETVQNSYGMPLEDFLKGQLGDMVTSCILAKWSYEYYKDIETDSAKLKETLEAFFDDAKKAQQADFNISDNFDSFITSLSTSSNIYYTPETAKNYVFVKNILIPFSTAQTTLLTNLQNQLGSAEAESYIAKRNEFATEIVAQYFDSDKYDDALENEYFDKTKWFVDKNADKEDEDSLWNAKDKVFAYENNQVAINSKGVLGQFFNDDGTIKVMDGKDADQTIIELMKRFNTDTAQHTAAYDYVVYVGNDWEDYSHSWVKEFYTAVNENLVDRTGGEIQPKKNHYTLCVSSYGVHIIYLTGGVNGSDKLFTKFEMNDRLKNGSPSYNLFKTYFDAQLSARTEDAWTTLRKEKLKDNDYIIKKDGFDKFLKDNGFTFDLDEFVENLRDEQ